MSYKENCDAIMDWNKAREIVDDKGWDAFLETLNKEFPDKDLYKCSTDWYSDNQFICKARGDYGDLIVGWEQKI